MLMCGLMAAGVLGQQSSDHVSWRGILVGFMVPTVGELAFAYFVLIVLLLVARIKCLQGQTKCRRYPEALTCDMVSNVHVYTWCNPLFLHSQPHLTTHSTYTHVQLHQQLHQP